jgi:hypothetical protein
VASGNGKPTSADAQANPVVVSAQGAIERVVDDMSHHFVAAVQAAGYSANLTTDFYGNGVHGWYYWQRDLGSFLRWLRPQLDKSTVRPATFSYRTARVASNAWGWSFRHDSGLTVPNVNTAEEFVYLSGVSTTGLTAQGDGALRVTTPKGSFPARSLHEVTVGRTVSRIRANADGQLRIKVTIAEMATHPQVDFPGSGGPASMPRVQVTISAVRPPVPSTSHLWAIALAAFGVALVSATVIWRVRRRLAR